MLQEGGDKYETPRSGNKDDKAHPPIHPTQLPNMELSNNEKVIYEFIVRRFLACCSKNAVGTTNKITFTIAEEIFTLNGIITNNKADFGAGVGAVKG